MRRLWSGVLVVMSAVVCFGLVTVWSGGRVGVAAQGRRALKREREVRAEPRVALVIGNSEYKRKPLENPVNDARAMAAALQACGFEVTVVLDGTRERMMKAVSAFGKRLRASGRRVGLFYYAGHGLQVKGENYLVPVDEKISEEEDVDTYGMSLGYVIKAMGGGSGQVNIVLLDACRDNPYERSFGRSRSSGLAPVDAPRGTLIGYATRPGQVASDGRKGRNGLYTGVLLKWMRQPGLSVEEVLKAVGREVTQLSKGEQVPWQLSSLDDDFSFVPGEKGKPVGDEGGGRREAELAAWEVVKGSEDVAVVEAFLREYPNGAYAGAARVKLEALRNKGKLGGGVPPGASGSGGGGSSGVGLRAGAVRSFGLFEMVWIPPGEFMMGLEKWAGDEKPVHRVRLSRGFWMGRYEVTQRQWEAVMEENPSYFKDCPDCPVESVSWEECQVFVRLLNMKYPVGGGLEYRLPSEAEWEYACRAGTREEYWGGDEEAWLARLGWYDGNSGGKTHPVGQKQPNGWGLYDMHGNVWEWCGDWYDWGYYGRSPVDDPRGPGSGAARVLRGGSWGSNAYYCRAACRYYHDPSSRNDALGFRLVDGAP